MLGKTTKVAAIALLAACIGSASLAAPQPNPYPDCAEFLRSMPDFQPLGDLNQRFDALYRFNGQQGQTNVSPRHDDDPVDALICATDGPGQYQVGGSGVAGIEGHRCDVIRRKGGVHVMPGLRACVWVRYRD